MNRSNGHLISSNTSPDLLGRETEGQGPRGRSAGQHAQNSISQLATGLRMIESSSPDRSALITQILGARASRNSGRPSHTIDDRIQLLRQHQMTIFRYLQPSYRKSVYQRKSQLVGPHAHCLFPRPNAWLPPGNGRLHIANNPLSYIWSASGDD